MNQRDLLLVGGGLVAGYVICKMMNRSSNMENFSADGKPSTSDATFYKWNGEGKAVARFSSSRYFTLTPSSDKFTLTGNSKMLRREPIVGGGGAVTNNSWISAPSGEGVEYVETHMVKSVVSGSQTFNAKVWFPKNSIILASK